MFDVVGYPISTTYPLDFHRTAASQGGRHLGNMGNLVSRKKKRERDHVTDQDRAVLDLKNSRDRLKRYQKKVTEAWSCPYRFRSPESTAP